MNRPQLTVKFEPRDLWVGCFWDYTARDKADIYDYAELRFYFCIVPMLPIILTLTWGGVYFRGIT